MILAGDAFLKHFFRSVLFEFRLDVRRLTLAFRRQIVLVWRSLADTRLLYDFIELGLLWLGLDHLVSAFVCLRKTSIFGCRP